MDAEIPGRGHAVHECILDILNRIDDVRGARNLHCSCVPAEDYAA
jgi:hypothetical protein